jgi:hypothetical protein
MGFSGTSASMVLRDGVGGRSAESLMSIDV